MSCSAWIVATISRIAPDRARTDLRQHRVGNPGRHIGGIGIVQMLVEVGSQVAVGERETPTERDAQGVDGRRPVERRRDRRPPVDHDRVVLVVFDMASPDVPAIAARPGRRRLVDPTEELAGAGRTQRVERLPHRHLDVFGCDVVGGAGRVDPLEPLDHAIATGACICQPGALAVEFGKRFDASSRVTSGRRC